jgi:PAS domain S-box-containing protein
LTEGAPGRGCQEQGGPQGSPYPKHTCILRPEGGLTAGKGDVGSSDRGRTDLGNGATRGTDKSGQVNGPLGEDSRWLRPAFENSSEVVKVVGPGGILRYASPAFGRILGHDPEEAVGKMNVFDHVHPEDRPQVLERIEEALAGGDAVLARAEFRFRHKDGSWRWMESVGTYLLDDPAVGGVVVTSRDVTERKEAEERLRRSERRFAATFEQAPVGMVQVRFDGSWIDFNDKVCEILGYTREELYGVPFGSIVLPEDLEKGRERGVRMLDGKLRDFSEEKLLRRKDGTQVWTRVTVSLVHTPSGPEHLVGVIEDITEAKKTEEALTRSDLLYHTVVEQAPESIFVVDLKTKRILEANTALGMSLGYRAEELKEMTLYDIVAQDREHIDEDAKRTIAEGYYYVGERSYRRKDGTLIDVEVSVSPVFYDGREAMSVVAHDTTERKAAEENLRNNLSMLIALREAGQILGSTLSSAEIVSRLLEVMRSVSSLTAAVLSIQDVHGNLRIWGAAGLEALHRRERFEQEAEVARRAALKSEEPRTFRLFLGSQADCLVGLCLPLRIKDHAVGVLEAYGKESLTDGDTVKILSSLTSQAASALENASLYEELGERERALQDLVGKLLSTQEEERRRVAYEVHDGLAQVAVAAHQNLQAFARRYPHSTEKERRELEQILKQVRATVSDARRIIANLRPTTLDDLGLGATLSVEVEHLREDGYKVDYVENIGVQRLPDPVAITLFRIAQEALRNVRKHARARRIRIRLERTEDEARLTVRDYGCGFDPVQASTGSGPGERVGLAGMRERASLLGGELKIDSRPDGGTSVTVTVPLVRSS